MKLFNSISLIFFLLSSLNAADVVPGLHDEYDPSKWPVAELRLSQAGTLKDLFDSGLRPYRFPGLENTTLEVKHLNLRTHLASGKRLPAIPIELMRIKPFRDGEVATMEGFTKELTLPEAKAELLKWLPFAANGRSEKDLDDYLRAVDTDYLDFDDPYRGIAHGCSVNWKEPGWKEKGGGPQITAWFRKTANPTNPLRLHFKISWSSNRVGMDRGTFRPESIEPPPGYEHVDMTAPKKFGPDSMVDILRSKGVDIGDGKGGIPQEEYLARQSEADQRPDGRKNSGPSKGEQSKKTTGWWIIAGALALLVLLALTWRKCRPQAEG